jgi:hypothetical protein
LHKSFVKGVRNQGLCILSLFAAWQWQGARSRL